MNVETRITHNGTTYVAELGAIEHASLGFEDHGFLSSFIHLDFAGSGQGFGGLVLGKQGNESATFLTEKWVRSILRVAGVDDWGKLQGATVYALRTKSFGTIEGLASRDGRRVFLSEEISSAALNHGDEFKAQHHLTRVSDDLKRAHDTATSLERTLFVLQRTTAEAIQDIAESEAQS